MNKYPYLLIAIGSMFWGFIGLFVKALYSFGFSSFQVVAIRGITASILLVGFLFFTRKDLLKIKPVDLKYFVGTGIFSMAFFNWCYFTAISEISLSLAVVLLYTGPVFVAFFSKFVFKEPFTKRKICSLILTILGCALVVGLIPFRNLLISWSGILIGLCSGLGYGLYSIFGKMASKIYSPLTITTYTFIFTSIIMIPISKIWEVAKLFLNCNVLMISIGLGLLPSALAYFLYTKGLTHVESSRASIMATIEPVVAMFLGVFVFNDKLSSWQLLGVIFILGAVILIQKKEVSQNKQTKIDFN